MTTKPQTANPLAYIPDHRRELYFRIIDDYGVDFHLLAHRLHFLEEHFPLEKLDAALRWLINENFTGVRFVNWFKHSCKGSDLEMHRVLLAVLDHAQLAPVIAGRNFRS